MEEEGESFEEVLRGGGTSPVRGNIVTSIPSFCRVNLFNKRFLFL